MYECNSKLKGAKMKPIKLLPSYKNYLWGGNKLINEYNKKTDVSPLAESWELSCHEDGPSYVYSDSSKTLAEYITMNGVSVLGKKCKKFSQFPILLKLIDAKDNLSIQVHPNNRYARKYENHYGKTEAWYILSAEKNSEIVYGLKNKISKKKLRDHILNNKLISIVNKVKVKKGDLFFIKPGTIHAIGKGIVIAEIQQNSNITYRVYDYNRKDINGNTRELHIEKACSVIKNIAINKKINYPKNRINKACDLEILAKCKYFKFSKITIKDKYTITVTKQSFISLLCIDGSGVLYADNSELNFSKGESMFCPSSNYTINIIGNCEILLTRL